MPISPETTLQILSIGTLFAFGQTVKPDRFRNYTF